MSKPFHQTQIDKIHESLATLAADRAATQAIVADKLAKQPPQAPPVELTNGG
jgi:hypothetical protein